MTLNQRMQMLYERSLFRGSLWQRFPQDRDPLNRHPFGQTNLWTETIVDRYHPGQTPLWSCELSCMQGQRSLWTDTPVHRKHSEQRPPQTETPLVMKLVMHAGTDTPCGQTDTYEHITLLEIVFAGGTSNHMSRIGLTPLIGRGYSLFRSIIWH